jgi:hypothetical protein
MGFPPTGEGRRSLSIVDKLMSQCSKYDEEEEEEEDEEDEDSIQGEIESREQNRFNMVTSLSSSDNSASEEDDLDREIENREKARLQLLHAIYSYCNIEDEKEDKDRAADLSVTNSEKEDNIANIQKFQKEQYRLLVALVVNDSSDSEDETAEETQARDVERRTLLKPHRVVLCDSDSESDDSDEDAAVLEAFKALTYLESKGIRLKKDAAALEYMTIAKAVMQIDDDVNYSAGLARGGSGHGSGSDCDSDSSDDIIEAEVLDAFRYLSLRGISLDDDADVSQYIAIMRAIVSTEGASSSAKGK